jgi:hypothetical protein
MAKNIVTIKNGRVVIRRKVVARGYHVLLDCNLKLEPFECALRERYLEEYTKGIERILDALQHPGYHRVEERILGYRKYYLRLVPVTKKTMLEYIKEFDEACEGQMELESGLELIQDDEVRNKAQDLLYDILAETAEGCCGV